MSGPKPNQVNVPLDKVLDNVVWHYLCTLDDQLEDLDRKWQADPLSVMYSDFEDAKEAISAEHDRCYQTISVVCKNVVKTKYGGCEDANTYEYRKQIVEIGRAAFEKLLMIISTVQMMQLTKIRGEPFL